MQSLTFSGIDEARLKRIELKAKQLQCGIEFNTINMGIGTISAYGVHAGWQHSGTNLMITIVSKVGVFKFASDETIKGIMRNFIEGVE